jgi:hypothetical protein
MSGSSILVILLSVVLSVTLLGAVISLLLFLYQQLLMTNEINKRLLLLSENSIENEKLAMEELNEELLARAEELHLKFNEEQSDIKQEGKSVYPDAEDIFNPHDALDNMN